MDELKQKDPAASPGTPEFAEDFLGDASSQRILEQLALHGRPASGQPADDLARCPMCGSSWFAELQFHQYRANVYSYGPGGDLQVASPAPVPVRFCLCGHVLEPNLTSQGVGRGALARMIDSFMESLERAAGFRSGIIQRAQQAITVAEMKPRDEILADAKNFIDRLRKRLSAEKQGRKPGDGDSDSKE